MVKTTTKLGRELRERQPLLPLSKRAGSLTVAVWWVLVMVGVAWYLMDTDGFWFLAGAAACFTVSLPLALGRGYDLISPWSLILIAAYIGYGLRGLVISLGINGSRTLDELYFLGYGPGHFFRPTIIFLIGLSLLTLGYVVGGARKASRRPFFGSRPHLNGGRVGLVVLACAMAGFVGFLLYAQSTGGLSLGGISAKRTVINGVNLEASYQSHGQYRVLSTFSAISFWLQLAWFAYRKAPHGILTIRGLWLAMLLVNAALLPVYASTRADVVYLIIGAVLIEFCLRGTTVNIKVLVSSVLVAVISVAALSSLRSSKDDSVQGAQVSWSVVVDTFVLTRTFADIPTTGHIINAVPSRLAYANGDTITAWLAAPIPRSVWPSKPIISSGPILGQAIYGNIRSGVPPGMIAESYWNFGLAGIFVIPLLCGLVMRRLSDYWAPYARVSPEAALLMAVVAVRPGIDLMTNSIGYAPFQLLQSMVLLAPVLWAVGTWTPGTRRRGHGGASRGPSVSGRLLDGVSQ